MVGEKRNILIYNLNINYSDKEDIKKEVNRLCRLLRHFGKQSKIVPYYEIVEPIFEAIQALSREYIKL